MYASEQSKLIFLVFLLLIVKIILDAPGLFTGFWSVVKPFVDPVSQKKMIFLPFKVRKGA